MSFPGVLFVVFLVLKLTHVIDWSWWWITAPLWAGLALYTVLFVSWVLGTAAVKGLDRLDKRLEARETKKRETRR